MKIVMLTVHEATSARKVDFHFWSDVLARRGDQVEFVTIGMSPLTKLKRQGRQFQGPFNAWKDVAPRVRKFLWRPLFHPMSLGKAALDALTKPLFALYPQLLSRDLLDGISDADVFIVENGAGLCLVPTLARKFPKASFVYSVCDRIATLHYHPIILEAERAALPYFSLVRVPAEVMVADYPTARNVQYIPHGLDKLAFDAPSASPYPAGTRNVVSVGDMLFDADAITTMAKAEPSVNFHLFGKQARLDEVLPNVVTHGELPFATITPYIQHADAGIAPYRPAPNADYLSQSSMKMIQYTYCRLPIIAPDFAARSAHMAAYVPGSEDSIVAALRNALSHDRDSIDNSQVLDWEGVTLHMLAHAIATPTSQLDSDLATPQPDEASVVLGDPRISVAA
ncbi:2-beta-glucuronyltransferase [Pseudoxanthomonas sp. GM95]|uniref:GumK N-terminal domain-containing glycosyltransferase n=1 Tax=Pseudoxanthomonas sp. GM95 TaxID=1881043 RepID=UPI0008D5E0AE|nr:glycosyltransferase [Pseudoxanthomonas sp. GM95]SEL62715.1 2-beta-glucuronyltransferase [Pseudoxanthomonas sp. GM95]